MGPFSIYEQSKYKPNPKPNPYPNPNPKPNPNPNPNTNPKTDLGWCIVNRKGRRGLEDRQTSKELALYVEGAHHVITKVHKRPEV